MHTDAHGWLSGRRGWLERRGAIRRCPVQTGFQVSGVRLQVSGFRCQALSSARVSRPRRPLDRRSPGTRTGLRSMQVLGQHTGHNWIVNCSRSPCVTMPHQPDARARDFICPDRPCGIITHVDFDVRKTGTSIAVQPLNPPPSTVACPRNRNPDGLNSGLPAKPDTRTLSPP